MAVDLLGSKPLSGSFNYLKKIIGTIMLLVNTADILESFSNVKEGGTLTKGEKQREKLF